MSETTTSTDEQPTCAVCGYDLRGLPRGANCPECGSDVWLSLRGLRLRFADPFWVSDLARGATFLAVAILLILITVLHRYVINTPLEPLRYVLTYIGSLGEGLQLVGLWMLASYERATFDRPRECRITRALRITIVASAIATAASHASGSTSFRFFLGFAQTALIVLANLRLLQLAKRVPDLPLIQLTPFALVALLIVDASLKYGHFASWMLELGKWLPRIDPLKESLLWFAGTAFDLYVVTRYARVLRSTAAIAKQNWLPDRSEPPAQTATAS